jgi:excinuclease UvrABC ATPase subunit
MGPGEQRGVRKASFVTVDMQLPSRRPLECEACKGTPSKRSPLIVYKGKNIVVVLDMTDDSRLSFSRPKAGLQKSCGFCRRLASDT